MTWPRHIVRTTPWFRIDYVNDERIRTEINPPSFRFFGVDVKGNGIYRRFNDARSRCKDGEFVSIPYHHLSSPYFKRSYEVIQ